MTSSQLAMTNHYLEEYLRFLETEVLPRSTESWRIGPEKFAKKLE